MLELAAGVAAVEVVVDPRLAGLLLRQCAGPVPRADRFEERATVGAAEVVTLPAAAVVEDLVAAVGIADVCETLGDLGDRGVPVDLLVAAVGTAPHGRGQPGAVVLVVVEAQCLVTGVTVRARMVLVAADLRQRAALGLYDDSAVALTEDARGGLPSPVILHRLIGPFRCGQRPVVYPGVSPELFSSTGKTALITGGTSGIGLMIAEGYLHAGARVYISSRKPDACEAAREQLGEFGEVYAIPADVSLRGSRPRGRGGFVRTRSSRGGGLPAPR